MFEQAARARLICDRLGGLAPVVTRQIEAKMLPTAGEVRISSLTAKLRRLTLAAPGPEAAEQHLQGTANRRVSVDREDDDSKPARPKVLVQVTLSLPTLLALATRDTDNGRSAPVHSRIGHVAKNPCGWSCEGDANEVLTWTSPPPF
jgi:hypothetical protein